jgi:hypothetical protein
VPFVVSAAHLLFGVGGDYLPVQDHSVIEMFVRDVGHEQVLVGLYSRADWSHPGPAEFYVLAPFYWLTGGASVGLWIGALAINAASIVGCAAVARRHGGTPVLLVTLVGCALVMRTLGADILADPWNTYIPVLPFLLMLFLTWAMLCGDLWALPVATVVGSFTAQTHVGFLALSMPLLVVGGVALVWPELRRFVRERRGSAAEGDADPEADVDAEAEVSVDADEVGRRRALVRAVGLAAGLFVLMWVPPVLDVLWNAPSNARQTIEWFQRADEGVHTLSDGVRVIVAQFGINPEWITGYQRPAFATGEPITLYRTPWPVLLPVVVAAAVVLWRRVEGARALVVTLGLSLVLGILAVARTVGPAYDYRLRWTWMIPVVAFVLVGWAVWRYLVRWRPAVEGKVLVPLALAGLLVLGVVNTVAAADAGMPYPVDTEIMTALSRPVLAAFDEDRGGMGGDGQVIVERYENHLGDHTYGRGLLLQLERHGIDARVPESHIRFLPEDRNQTEGPVRAHLLVASDEEVDELRDDPDYTMLAIWSPLSEEEQADIAEQFDELQEEFAAHRIDKETWLVEGGELSDKLFGGRASIVYTVAIFLDEHVGQARSWSPPNS